MKTKAWKAGLFGALALASFAPAAQADEDGGPFSGYVTLTSDYRFRGQSQSDREGAIQGSIQYDHKSGFFANIWASNVDFNDAGVNTVDDTNVEIDLTVGYNHSFSEQTTGTIKAVYYWYPDADQLPAVNDYDYFELIASLAHDFGTFAVNGEAAWSPDYFFETSDSFSLKGGASYPVMDNFAFMGALTASANVGYQWIDNNTAFGTPDYLYFDIGGTVEWDILAIDLRWIDTDLDNAECFGGTKLCEGGVVLSITANLP